MYSGGLEREMMTALPWGTGIPTWKNCPAVLDREFYFGTFGYELDLNLLTEEEQQQVTRGITIPVCLFWKPETKEYWENCTTTARGFFRHFHENSFLQKQLLPDGGEK